METFENRVHYHKVITNPDYEFSWMDHWEVYDPSKQYPTTVFTAHYRGPEKRYLNILITDPHQSYVIAREQISEEERKLLAPFCQCYSCKSWLGRVVGIGGSFLSCLTCDFGQFDDHTIKTARMAYLKSLQ
jgi:hypothetical protein